MMMMIMVMMMMMMMMMIIIIIIIIMKCVELAQNRAKDCRDTKFCLIREFVYVNNSVQERTVRLSLTQIYL